MRSLAINSKLPANWLMYFIISNQSIFRWKLCLWGENFVAYLTCNWFYFALKIHCHFYLQFYHACDAEVYSYCLIRINVLQFCDFYLAILSVWITLIAMAKLPNSFQSFIHMAGAVGVALGVEYDRTGLWVFVLPTGIGLVILLTSWVSRMLCIFQFHQLNVIYNNIYK